MRYIYGAMKVGIDLAGMHMCSSGYLVRKYMYTSPYQEFTHEHTQYACEHCRTHVYVAINRSNLFNRPA